jgi:hypothetical protein
LPSDRDLGSVERGRSIDAGKVATCPRARVYGEIRSVNFDPGAWGNCLESAE